MLTVRAALLTTASQLTSFSPNEQDDDADRHYARCAVTPCAAKWILTVFSVSVTGVQRMCDCEWLQSLSNDARANTDATLVEHRKLAGRKTLILTSKLHQCLGAWPMSRLCPLCSCMRM